MTENWPGNSASVVRLLRAQLDVSTPEVGVEGLKRIRIAAALDGDDLTALSVDATGASLTITPSGTAASAAADRSSGDAAAEPATEPAVVQRRRGAARSIRIIAEPVKIQRVPLSLDVRLADVPIDWVVYDRPANPRIPETIRGIEVADEGAGSRGTLSFSMRVDDIARLIRRLAGPFSRRAGMRLGRVDVNLEQDGSDGIRVSARAGMRWKVLFASARVAARVGIAPDGILTLRALQVRSGNPLVAIGLRIARKHLREAVGKSVDINADLPTSSPRLSDLRVHVDEEVHVSARIGHA